MKKQSSFKMKGFTGFGNSPIKAKTKSTPAENLLKAVPNEKAYNKLSSEDKKGFDKAAKKAGLPTKKSPTKKAIKESMTETSQEALKGAKRGLKDSLKEAKTIKKRTIKKTLKVDNRGRRKSDRFKKPSEMTVYDYENDDRGMRKK